jgi:hypothetical protein
MGPGDIGSHVPNPSTCYPLRVSLLPVSNVGSVPGSYPHITGFKKNKNKKTPTRYKIMSKFLQGKTGHVSVSYMRNSPLTMRKIFLKNTILTTIKNYQTPDHSTNPVKNLFFILSVGTANL